MVVESWRLAACSYLAAIFGSSGLLWNLFGDSSGSLPIGPIPIGLLVAALGLTYKIGTWKTAMEHTQKLAEIESRHAAELRGERERASRTRMKQRVKALEDMLKDHGVKLPDVHDSGDDVFDEE